MGSVNPSSLRETVVEACAGEAMGLGFGLSGPTTLETRGLYAESC